MIVISISALIVLLICYIIYKNTRNINAISVLFIIGVALIGTLLEEVLDIGSTGSCFFMFVIMLCAFCWAYNKTQQ